MTMTEGTPNERFSYDAKSGAVTDTVRGATLKRYAFGPLDPDQVAFEYRDSKGALHLFGRWRKNDRTSEEDAVEIRFKDVELELRRYFGGRAVPENVRSLLIPLTDIIRAYLSMRAAALGGDRRDYDVIITGIP